jgi:hypothetical protein
MVGRAAALATVALAAALLACTGGDDRSTSTTTTEAAAFDDQVCSAVSAFLEDLTAEVNRFQSESRDADGTADRRRLYLDAWDRVAQVNEDLAEAVAALDPQAEPFGVDAVDALTAALEANRAEVTDGVEEATALPDDAYDRITVPDGSLFTGAEKMRATVRFALAEVLVIGCG